RTLWKRIATPPSRAGCCRFCRPEDRERASRVFRRAAPACNLPAAGLPLSFQPFGCRPPHAARLIPFLPPAPALRPGPRLLAGRKIVNGKSVPEPGVPLERDRHAVMRAWLRKLPERTLMVFIAHRVEGKSYAAIAAEHGIVEWRVRWHMRKAIRH